MKKLQEAIDYIHSTNKFGSVLGLENIRILLEKMGNPQEKLKFIHIAGTNGKGSTSSYIINMLKAKGYEVGLFSSPYLEVFNERIRINDDNIDDNSLAEITFIVKEKVDEMLEEGCNHPTEFEIVTAIGMEYFLRQGVDFVVLEVGLGGRYDSTNIISKSAVSIITPIAMDHIDVLGDTLEKIAYEKAGIIKKNGLVVSYPQQDSAMKVVEEVADELDADLIISPNQNINIKEIDEKGSKFDFKYGENILNDLEIKLIGRHQVENAALAITSILRLKEKGIIDIDEKSIKEGLIKTRWIGRLELISEEPRFIIDGAHNLQGIEALKNALSELFNYNKLILGLGILADKDVDSMIAEMAPLGDIIIATEPNIFRAMKADELGEKLKKYNENVVVEKDIDKAIEKALSLYEENDLILFSGSLYLIGDIRSKAKRIL
ncbi:MAG: folylpolyglutamate synthase/dihydrofolate synthase family protein [Andreesenia angusta]|nr:folylpolyglutamate synthase/dihydrofolate synthase family protein [Andreesenia angusta]